ncbi:MAG: trimethylamine methyltransferase family protein [Anaerolineae bacterium]|nr:trimethylamine methyltransferase family protein [Anaerolineae bacterium]
MPTNWNEVLSPEDIARIHATSMRYLENVGVHIPSDDALAVFKVHGARTNGHIVFLEEQQVMDAIASVPARFTIHARAPQKSVVVGGGELVFAPAYGAPFLVDYAAGKRAPTLQDYHNLAKLAHALPNQDMSGHLMVEPEGVSAAYLQMLYANMVYSDKAFIGSAEGKKGAEHTLAMAGILFGADFVAQNPVTISLINSLTPLGYSDEMLEALLVFAHAGQPVVVAALAMAGSTSPVTLAGTLALQNAELLAGVALTQWINPGTPVVYGSTSTNIDMRTGALAIGSPELSMMIAAHAQLARHYGLPARSGGSLTDSSVPDAQAGFESMLGLVTTAASGVDFVLHAAGILSSYLAFSYEKFVMDDEMCGIVRRYRKGIEVTDATLAYDIGAKVGPGGNFLMETHTVKRCRTEFWSPDLVDRGGLEAWMSGGQQTVLDRANRRWKKLLERYEQPAMDESVAQQLEAFVKARS